MQQLRALGLYSLFSCAFSQDLPSPVPTGAEVVQNGYSGYALAEGVGFPDAFESTSGLLETVEFEDTALQGRQLRCFNPGWVPCPNVPGKCAPPGATCCSGSGYWVMPSTGFCCPNSRPCAHGNKCCSRSCCVPDGICGSDGLCSTRNVPKPTSAPRPETTSQKSTTSTSSSETSRSSTSTGTEPYSTGACRTNSPDRRDLEARRYPWEDYCTRICHVGTKQEMVVLNVKRIAGETDQLVDSMCRGMRARQKAGQIQKDLNDGEDILQYNGKDNRVTTVNCKGFCVEANRAVGRNSYQCDEYPPAAFNQQSNAQTRLCIEQYQNSGTQAPLLSQLVKNCGLGPNDKVLFRIEGGCSGARIKRGEDEEKSQGPGLQLQTLQARQDTTTLQLSGANATLRNPNGDESLTYVAIDLGLLENGHYDLDINLGGQVDNMTVLDADGSDYATVNSVTGNTRLSFDVNIGDDYVPFALIAYTNKAVNVSYTGKRTDATPNTGTTTTVRGVKALNLAVSMMALSIAVFAMLV